MEGYTLKKLVVVGALLLFLAKLTSAQLRSRCASQMALATQACFMMQLTEEAAEISDNSGGHDSRHSLGHSHGSDGHGHGRRSHEEGRGHSQEDGHRHEHSHADGHRHRRGHGQEGARGHEHRNGDGHGRGHGHSREAGRGNRQGHEDAHGRHGKSHGDGHGHGHVVEKTERSAEEDCCRWLKEVDAVCVCDVLLRLPTFLVKPRHAYSLAIGDECNVTYNCGGM